MMYELTHGPDGTTLKTPSLEVVVDFLKRNACESCLVELPHYFSEMSVEDQVEELLLSQCGAEWILERVEDE